MRVMQGYSKKVHDVERGFWSAGTYMHIRLHLPMHLHIHAYTRAHKHDIGSQVRTSRHTCVFSLHARTGLQAFNRAHTHVDIRVRMHKHKRTHTHTHLPIRSAEFASVKATLSLDKFTHHDASFDDFWSTPASGSGTVLVLS